MHEHDSDDVSDRHSLEPDSSDSEPGVYESVPRTDEWFPPERGSSRPPFIHPDIWRNHMHISTRRRLAREYKSHRKAIMESLSGAVAFAQPSVLHDDTSCLAPFSARRIVSADALPAHLIVSPVPCNGRIVSDVGHASACMNSPPVASRCMSLSLIHI